MEMSDLDKRMRPRWRWRLFMFATDLMFRTKIGSIGNRIAGALLAFSDPYSCREVGGKDYG